LHGYVVRLLARCGMYQSASLARHRAPRFRPGAGPCPVDNRSRPSARHYFNRLVDRFMEALFTDFREFVAWMSRLPPVWAYVALLIVAYGENVIPPIPGDMVIVFGGYLAGVGRLQFLPVVLTATLGGALGFMTMYAIGGRIGNAVFDPSRFHWLPKHHIHRSRRWLERWGYGVVAANRFLSGVRSVIALAVGMARMDPRKTLLFASLSAGLWTVLIAYGGYALGENWVVVGYYLRAYGRVVAGVLAVVALGAILYMVIVRRYGRSPGRG
jgi:membrane protein DedA with SNARE-associated domain